LAESDQPIKITIIGGGFCGILTAINLLQDPEQHLHIHIINKEYDVAKGVAYNPHTTGLLLNVPNGGMSAFPDIPDHFLQWLIERNPEECVDKVKLATEFSTRKQYGEYLGQLWRDELDKQGYNKRISIYKDKAVDIIEKGSQLHVCLNNHPGIIADVVVLATGNDQPNFAAGLNASLKDNTRYFGDPWKKECIEGLETENDVLIIGNGLTMVDTVLGLAEKGCISTIHTISPHGYRLKPWKEAKTPYDTTILGNDTRLIDLVKTINKHRKIADKLNQSIYPVVDSLRPKIQSIWLSFNPGEKQQFLSTLSTFWDRIRHRLPTQMHHIIENMRAENKLITHKGYIVSAVESGGRLEVTINSDGCIKQLGVQRIINCTGPDTNITRSGNELLSNLAKKGLICPGPFNLGINTHPGNNSVITASGVSKPHIFVIGNNLKGVLWESSAVPELRAQAKKLAAHILSTARFEYPQAV
jgi:uncharacterized NAD(P)/FAD-binding protein YdhS